MGIEYEWKLKAEPQVQEALFRETEGIWRETAMETTYYDTADGQLSSLHYTLRRRTENGKSVCTIKTPSADGGRGEWEVEETSIEQAIPKLCKLGGPENLLSLTQNGIQAICGAKFLRRFCQINLDKTVVELALDRGILTGGTREIPLCEVEIELKEGSKEAAAAFAMYISQNYGLTPEKKSKFRRALDLTKE